MASSPLHSILIPHRLPQTTPVAQRGMTLVELLIALLLILTLVALGRAFFANAERQTQREEILLWPL